MLPQNLDKDELTALIERVFRPREEDRTLAVLVDLPDREDADTDAWRLRRDMAAGWVKALRSAKGVHGLDVQLVVYPNVGANNADLPAQMWPVGQAGLPSSATELDPAGAEERDQVLSRSRLILAPTQFSATAPLKMLSRKLGVRAATMPGFSLEMIPALRVDYGEVNRRVRLLTDLLDEAVGAEIRFSVEGMGQRQLFLDLRHRTGHASGGLLPEPGTAGNLPSGEAYIVPYEGEVPNDPTTSQGELPVQMGDEVVLFRVHKNRAVEVLSDGPVSVAQSELLQREPAYGNLAELGLGVLGDFGVEPVGEVLLDEKLGLHIAFGRSEHFGGQVGPGDFSRPEAVVHQDHVYIHAMQPRVEVALANLVGPGGKRTTLMREGRYVVGFG